MGTHGHYPRPQNNCCATAGLPRHPDGYSPASSEVHAEKLLECLADTGNAWLLLLLKCYFTSTETVGLLGTGAQDVHLDFHTAPEVCARLSVEDVLQCPGLAHVSIVVCHQLQCLCFWSLALLLNRY